MRHNVDISDSVASNACVRVSIAHRSSGSNKIADVKVFNRVVTHVAIGNVSLLAIKNLRRNGRDNGFVLIASAKSTKKESSNASVAFVNEVVVVDVVIDLASTETAAGSVVLTLFKGAANNSGDTKVGTEIR